MEDHNEEFWGIGGKEAFLTRIREENRQGLELGVRMGWWPSFNEKTQEPDCPPKIFKISNFVEQFGDKVTLGHVMAKAEIFPSASIARKNGWNDPIRTGDFFVTKRKIHVRIVE